MLPPPLAVLIRLTLPLWAGALLAACSAPAVIAVNTDNYDLHIDMPGLTELSGLAASHRHTDVYWGHNDSGHSATLYRFSAEGTPLGTVAVKGAKAFDWEDLASFSNNQGHWLAIGDIGDNYALRRYVVVYVLAEPDRSSTAPAKIQRHYRLRYPDGPRDAEGLAIDPQTRHGYILSKRDPHPTLYRFALDDTRRGTLTLERLGEVKSLPTPSRHQRQAAGDVTAFSPTALAFDAQGRGALVVTPADSYYFPRQPGDSWLATLNRTPIPLGPPQMPQLEAGTLSAEGRSVLLGSEGYPTPLWRQALPGRSAPD